MTEALVGAIVAAGLAFIGFRVRHVQIGQATAQAFFEELSAVAFFGTTFAGFTTQVFDSQFDKLFALPASLRRDLMRYHWRMKYLAQVIAHQVPLSDMTVQQAKEAFEQHWTMSDWITDVEQQRNGLVRRLDAYWRMHLIRLFFNLREPQLPKA